MDCRRVEVLPDPIRFARHAGSSCGDFGVLKESELWQHMTRYGNSEQANTLLGSLSGRSDIKPTIFAQTRQSRANRILRQKAAAYRHEQIRSHPVQQEASLTTRLTRRVRFGLGITQQKYPARPTAANSRRDEKRRVYSDRLSKQATVRNPNRATNIPRMSRVFVLPDRPTVTIRVTFLARLERSQFLTSPK